MYLGLAPEIAMSCFDMNLVGNEAEKIARKTAKKIGNKESLITDADTNCFNVNRYVLNNESSENLIGCAIYVVTEGEGYLVVTIFSTDKERRLFLYARLSVRFVSYKNRHKHSDCSVSKPRINNLILIAYRKS